MKKICTFLFCTLCFTTVFAQEQLIIQLESSATPKSFITSTKVEIEHEKVLFERLNIHLFQLPLLKAKDDLILEQLNRHPLIKSVSWDEEVESRATIPNDRLYPEQFALDRIQAPNAWDITTGGTTANGDEIAVGIVDQDFSITQSDIVENIWVNPGEEKENSVDDDNNGFIDDINGWNFDNSSNQLNEGVHGTPITGIIGAKGNNEIGTAGINWDVKMVLAQHNFRTSQLIESYGYFESLRRQYNESNGASGAFIVAVNSSLGLVNPTICPADNVWNVAQQAMGEVGILAINSAKNQPIDSDVVGDIPSSCPSDFIISVLGTEPNDDKFSSSACGDFTIDLGAPYNVIAPFPFDEYRDFGGNSSATPHVTGAVALLYSLPSKELADLATEKPMEAALLIKKAILNGVDKVAALEDCTLSDGRLNLFKSMQYLESVFNPNPTTAEKLAITSISPNPTNGLIQFAYETPGTEEFPARVYNAIGQLVYKEKVQPCCFGETNVSINTSNWASGTYIIVLEDEDERVVERFVVY